MIGGPGEIVQLDESVMFKAKYNRGRKSKSRLRWVFGGYCKNQQRYFLVEVKDIPKKTLIPFIMLAPGSIIYTDKLKSYHQLGKVEFTHFTVNHKLDFVTETGIHTQGVEALFSFKTFERICTGEI